jgi:predicted PurR-regulated permease PerM
LRHVAGIGHEDAPTGQTQRNGSMTSRGALIMLGLCTAVLVLAGLYFARAILAPVAFSLFVVAVVWPLQRRLEAWMPRLVALVVTLVVTLLVVSVLGYLVVWAFGTVGRWLIDNALRFQALYMRSTASWSRACWSRISTPAGSSARCRRSAGGCTGW